VAASLIAVRPQLAVRTPFDKRTSSHFVLYQDVAIDEASGLRGSRRFEQLVLAELECAYDRLQALLGLEPPRPINVVIYDPAVFDRQFTGLFRFPAAGFYHGVIRVRRHRSRYFLSRVLRHELVHAALDAAMPRRCCRPTNEGLASGSSAREAAFGEREVRSLIPARARCFPRQLSASFTAGPDATALFLKSYGNQFSLYLGERAARVVEEIVRA
jgi:hypothetical protein